MRRRFSLAYLTLPGIDPIRQIQIAGEAGYDYVSLRTIPMGLPNEPQVHLEEDPALLRQIRDEMEQYGVKLLDIELVRIREDLSSDYRAIFEAGASLGAKQILSSVWTEDFDFAVKRYRDVCRQAAEFDMQVNMEFPLVSSMTTFDQTVEMQERIDEPNLKILIDTIYAHWDNVDAAKIKSIDPDRYGVIHLCDCPRKPYDLDTREIIREGREYCGYGEAKLPEMLKALPANPCSLELPNLKYIEKYGQLDHARRCLESAKALFYTHEI